MVKMGLREAVEQAAGAPTREQFLELLGRVERLEALIRGVGAALATAGPVDLEEPDALEVALEENRRRSEVLAAARPSIQG